MADHGNGMSSGDRRLRGAIFDFGGVLTEPLFRPRSDLDENSLRLLVFFVNEARDVYHLPTGRHDLHLLETGRISEAEFFDRLVTRYAAAGHPPVASERAREIVFGGGLVACGAMVDAVAQVRAAGIVTAMLTNIARDSEQVWRSIIPVDELFDVVVDSSVVGLRKPDAAIFQLTCERLGVPPRDCLFVDDIRSNVDAAAALGLEVIHCIDPVDAAERVVQRVLGRSVATEI